MSEKKLIISPKTKVGELLDAFPQLENVLLELSPAFAKLKNPILRKTVARVASLQQIAVIGGLKVDEIVNRLRKETGQDIFTGNIADSEYLSTIPPKWFDEEKVSIRFDAIPAINSGESPMNDILEQTHQLQTGEIFELQTPFVPAPIIDMLKNKGFKVYSVQKSEVVVSYVSR